ncbi:MAG: hypothetical protein FWE61_02340 [Micrococcales bacterium]|nr:hypothetical protein [Micrococcales bacterium]
MLSTRGRRWATALALVDVVLVAVFAVLAVRQFGRPDATAPPPDTIVVEPVDFTMPSGNVQCQMGPDRVVCAIANAFTWPQVTCRADHVVVLDATGARAACANEVTVVVGDGQQTVTIGGAVFPAGAQQLEYGQTQTLSGFTCESRTAGVLCRNSAGQWFTLRVFDGLRDGGPEQTPPTG